MKFSTLMDILSKAGIISDAVISKDCEITDLNLMDQDYRNFSDNTVYFLDAEKVGFSTAIPNCLLYCGRLSDQKQKTLVNAARISSGSVESAFRFVKTQLDTAPQAQQRYVDIVSKLVMGNSLNLILSEMFNQTGNLFAAIDMSGKILAHSSPFYVDYPIWMHSMQQGYCDELLMDYIESRRQTSQAPAGEVPFQLLCVKSSMNVLVVRIIHENNLLGYFFAINASPNFDNQTVQLLPLFAQRIKQTILRLKSYDSYNSIMQNNILLDAVAGASPDETALRTKIACLKFPGYMRVLVIRVAGFKEAAFFEQALLPAIMEILPELPCFPWRNSLVALIATDSNGNVSGEIQTSLKKLAEQYHLLCGISNYFSNISEFSEYYRQATKALSYSSRVEFVSPFFFFQDYTLFMLIDRVQDDRLLEQCCHPALKKLLDYDAKKGTELFNTLRIFTQCVFNKSETAESLFTHRNTVTYRIQQIEEICGINLCDFKLLFPMQVSFQIFSYQNRNRADLQ
ncbi:MAG: helix-turn-helix domain-containing protein [Oscillibacter sp.]|jgi:hypothetical protein|nr:helix-turn-helix domain-containing protein [Oscillibacter sp.]